MAHLKELHSGWHTALDSTLWWHLGHNMYPPAHEAFEAAKAAVLLGREGKFDDECPHVRSRDGTRILVRDIIENLRLEDFLYLTPSEA